MKAYKITATGLDGNGVRISSNTGETLGEAYGVTYLTKERAEEVREDLASNLPEEYESYEYEVNEIEIDALKEGARYDMESVRAVSLPLPNGQNIENFFRNGRYLGADEDGTEPTMIYA